MEVRLKEAILSQQLFLLSSGARVEVLMSGGGKRAWLLVGDISKSLLVEAELEERLCSRRLSLLNSHESSC